MLVGGNAALPPPAVFFAPKGVGAVLAIGGKPPPKVLLAAEVVAAAGSLALGAAGETLYSFIAAEEKADALIVFVGVAVVLNKPDFFVASCSTLIADSPTLTPRGLENPVKSLVVLGDD